MKLTNLLSLSGTASVLLGLMSIAQANTTTPVTSAPYTGLTDFPSGATVSVPKFNPALGILSEVDLIVSTSITSNITVTAGASGAVGKAFTDVQVTVSDPASLIAQGLDPNTSKYSFNLGANAVAHSGNLAGSGSEPVSGYDAYTTTAILNEFKGGGNITLPVSTVTTTNLSYTSGNATASQSTSATVTATVRYVYSPVATTPEPGSIALLSASVLSGTGLYLRRRRNR